VLRCPLNVPARPTALKRLLHLASFSLSSSVAVLAQWRWKPERVVRVVPTLFCAPQALLLAKLSGAKSVMHVQDYEVDALFGLSIAQGGLLKRFAYAMERALLRGFDRVSTISSGMLQRARPKGVAEDKLCFFPNGSETARFRDVARSPVLLRALGVDPDKRVLLYSGNILAAGGNAVITADADTTLGVLCTEHPGIALRAEPESVSALIEGIERCLALPQPNAVATAYAGEFLDKDRILERFLAEL